MQSFNLRTATLEDLDTLLQLEQGIIEAERPYDETLKLEKIHYYDIKAMILSSNVELLVAESEGKIIGSGYARIEAGAAKYQHERYAYLGFMYVLPKFRRKGVNGLIMDDLKAWCKSQQVYELQLEVYSENEQAVKAYEKAGFASQMIRMRMKLEE